MKKQELLDELKRLVEMSAELERKVKLDLETVNFYNREADRLIAIIDDDAAKFEEKELAYMQMESLLGKIGYEKRQLEKNTYMKEMEKIDNHLNMLYQISRSGELEN